jgi:CHAT domain-containing protein
LTHLLSCYTVTVSGKKRKSERALNNYASTHDELVFGNLSMRESLIKIRKYPHLHLLLVLALLQQIVIANANAWVYSGNSVRSFEPLAISQQLKPNDVREIRPGAIIERSLSGGECHVYIVTLKAGEYMKVAVQSSTIALSMDALDPNDKVIANISPWTSGPTDSLWALAETTGNFQIRIAANEGKESYGRYRISLETVAELETAPASDQAYVKAHRRYWEATRLSDQGGDQPLHQATEKYQDILPQWRALGDRLGEASTLHMIGYAYDRLGESPKAVDFYKQALSIWRALKIHSANQANTLYNLGSIYSFTGNVAEATACYKEAIDLQRLRGNKGGQAYVLSNLGQVYTNIGEFQAALDVSQEALRLRIDIGDVEGQARSLSNISGVYFRLGEFQEALNYCKRALPLRLATGDRRGEAVTLSNLGTNYRELGDPQRALDYYQQALPLLREKADRINEGGLLDAIGQAYFDLGDYPKALDYQTQSLQIRHLINDRYGEGASLASVGRSYARLGDRKKALENLEQSLQLRRATGDRRGEALTLRNAGELYRESGDKKKALAYFNDGLALSRAIKNRFAEANLLYDIARLEQSAGQLDPARRHAEDAIAIIESTRARVASTDLRASFFASKQDFFELEIDLLMQSQRRDQNQESLVKAFGISEQRRARSLLDSLAEARANIRRAASPELLARERALRGKLDQEAESQIKLLSGKHTPEQAAALAKEVETVSTNYEQVLAEITASDPRYAALTQSAPLSLNEFQGSLLDKDTVLLEYSLGKERSYLWTVTPTEITGYELPAREEIETQARNVYDLLTARNRFVKFEEPNERQTRIARADTEFFSAARRLSQAILGPASAKLTGKRLLIVSDGALQYLPFAALPSPEPAMTKEPQTRESYRPLIADHEVTYLPSASILGVLRREVAGRKPAPKTVAVLADPVFSKTDERVMTAVSARRNQRANSHQAERGGDSPESELVRAVRDVGGENGLEIDRLPSTRREAEVILSLTPRTEQFAALDFHANRAAATNPQLGQYRIVHFATHGLLNTTHPGLSGLILSLVDRRGNDQNGFLPTHEVFDLNLPADLVVLSGCRTGLGKEIKGEGMLGLTRGFMYAGAARVAVSLWDVSDQSTAELMARFYRGMLGKKRLSPAAALREAQVGMWSTAGARPPYYWAAFVLQGEYR